MSDNNLQNPSPPLSFPGQGIATASLVIGIISLVFFGANFFQGGSDKAYIICIIFSIVGFALAVTGKKKKAEAGEPPGLSTTGQVVSIIALVLSGAVFVLEKFFWRLFL